MQVTLTQLELKKLRSAEALYYSYALLNLSHQAMWPACCKIPADNSELFVALAGCWSFIDSLHRIREILQGAPGINSKSAEMRSFLGATSLSEDYRHYIQHLRREVSKDPPNSSPVYGSLSWVDPIDQQLCHTALLGVGIENQSYTSCVFDTHENRWVSTVCLGVMGSSFNFDPIFVASEKIKNYALPLLTDGAPLQWPPPELPLFSARFDLGGQHT